MHRLELGAVITVERLGDAPVARRRIELVERKGVGHPDTVCDSLVEAISIALNKMYVARLGAVAHYNVDKALLVAGQCQRGFGTGEVLRPMELIIGDRATVAVDGERLPVEEEASKAVDRWMTTHLPNVRPGRDLATRFVLAPGSEELRRIYTEGGSEIASNDTCGASGYAPLSPTEQLVLDVEHYLNSPDFKRGFPDTGQDVKVLAVREDERVAVTVAMPLSCLAIASEAAYFRRRDEVLHALKARFDDVPLSLEWRLNCLDRPGLGVRGTYLTLTGTSAEDADSGQVGRGNRANGLIAFSRPTGGEATAGKNPVAHAGKIYSVLSHRLAKQILARCAGLIEVYVHLAARIGEPVDRPWTGVQVVPSPGVVLGDVEPAIREVVDAELARLPEFRAELVRGEHPVC
ncbi:MAG TPA: methionine adenosyltransferase [Candidatus Methylomirabilis sp.]|nr:methionine adenosyltransferase [Candidatus Methylomirabilis sp.]